MEAVRNRRSPAKAVVFTAMFTALIVIGSKITIPFYLVPFTLQVFFVMLAGKIGGKFTGMASVIVFIVLGLIGLPVFSKGGGFEYALMPTFGYILGFIPAVVISGIPDRTKKPSFFKELLFSVLADLSVYAFAVPYLIVVATFVLNAEIEIAGLLVTGFLIFLPTDILQCALASYLAVKLRPLVKI